MAYTCTRLLMARVKQRAATAERCFLVRGPPESMLATPTFLKQKMPQSFSTLREGKDTSFVATSKIYGMKGALSTLYIASHLSRMPGFHRGLLPSACNCNFALAPPFSKLQSSHAVSDVCFAEVPSVMTVVVALPTHSAQCISPCLTCCKGPSIH